MSYLANVYKVMIASPNDVISERNIVREILYEWNVINSDKSKMVLLPIGWETHSTPSMGDNPQSIINKQILKDCDLLVGIFWTRVGTATDSYASGTIEEIEEHIITGKPEMLYFSNSPVHPDSVDNNQYSQLKEFKKSCQSRGLYETFSNVNEFKDKFFRQLQLKINNDEYFKEKYAINEENVASVSTVSNVPDLSKEAKVLLKEAANDSNGTILKVNYIGGMNILTNDLNFIADMSPRTIALWESALEELLNKSLVSAQGFEGEVFKVTNYGYEIAEIINV
jgi:hypothetical protein